jgi:multimeric flavodoxin WrbA
MVYRPVSQEEGPKSRGKKIVLLSDVIEDESNLSRMISMFRQSMPYAVNVFHLREIGMKGGCLECLEHGCDNDCRYLKPFKKFYEQYLFMADAVIFAGTIKDRHLSAIWKLFWDRTFVYGHTPTLAGKPVAYLLSGPLNQLPNLRESLKAYAQLISQSTMVDMVTDEYESSERLTNSLKGLAEKLSWVVEHHAKTPVNFYGHAGRLVFQNFTHQAHGIFVPSQQYHIIRNFYDFSQPVSRKASSFAFLKILQRLSLAKFWKKDTFRESTLKDLQRIVEDA